MQKVGYKWLYEWERGGHGLDGFTRIFLELMLKIQHQFQKNPRKSVQSAASAFQFVSQWIQKCNLKMKHPKKSAQIRPIRVIRVPIRSN
jgi:hypothetical protein